MVKTSYKCVICNNIGKVNICTICNNKFCSKCITKSHQGCVLNKNIDKERINFINQCPFKCVYSSTKSFCFDCGESYINMIKCLCCNTVSCSMCVKKNLFRKKKFKIEDVRTAKLFCSLSCYEIFMDNPNNKWVVCPDCGTEYFDITHKKLCSLCSLKCNFEKDILFNSKRVELQKNLLLFLEENYLEIKDIDDILAHRVKEKSDKIEHIIENKVTLNTWLNELNAGYNMCYNIWDEIVNDFIKN